MLVAVCDQNLGNSTFFCSKAGASLPGISASRVSHSISSNGSRPGIVKKRRTPRFALSCATVFTSFSSVISTVSTALADAISPTSLRLEWYVLRHGSRGRARVERTAQNREGVGRIWLGLALLVAQGLRLGRHDLVALLLVAGQGFREDLASLGRPVREAEHLDQAHPHLRLVVQLV